MSAPALVSCAAAAMLIAVPVLGASEVLITSARVSGVADASALAAADAAVGWLEGEPCHFVATLAESASAVVDQCEVDLTSGEARVTISASTFIGPVRSKARAGTPGY